MSPGTRLIAVLSVVIILAGVAARLYQIDYNFDGDEVFSVRVASGSLAEVMRRSIEDRTQPPLHNVLLHFWVQVFGPSEVSARMLSVLASLGFLLVLRQLTMRLMHPWAALFVLSVCAMSPFFVYYGQQARPYAFVPLFAVLSVYLFTKGTQEPRRWTYPLAYGLSCLGLIYTQYLGLLVLLPQFAALALSRTPGARRLLSCGLVGAGAILPWLLVLGQNLSPSKLAERIGWIARPDLFSVLYFDAGLLGHLSIAHGTALAIVLNALILSALVAKFRSGVSRELRIVAALAFFAPLVVLLLSRYGPLSIWAPRQMLGSAVFVVCLMGMALQAHRRWIAIPLAALALAWCVAALPARSPAHVKPPWRAIAGFLEANCRGCDVLVPEIWLSGPLSYYSTMPVREVAGYQAGRGAERIAVLCRPVRCEGTDAVDAHYSAVSTRKVTWTAGEPSSSNTVMIRILAKRSGAVALSGP